MTKAAVAQWGPSTCPVTEALSSASDCRAETACHEAFLVSTFGCPRGALRFLANGLEANIPITWVEIGGEDSFPVLKFSDTIHFLAKENLVGLLAGDMEGNELSDTLLTFWRRFGKLQGDHEVFSSSIPLSRAIPILIHGDEGRNYKRSGIMVLSLQGAIGHGTEPFLKRYTSEGDRNERMGLNFAGSSFRKWRRATMRPTLIPGRIYRKNTSLLLSYVVSPIHLLAVMSRLVGPGGLPTPLLLPGG